MQNIKSEDVQSVDVTEKEEAKNRASLWQMLGCGDPKGTSKKKRKKKKKHI